MREATEEERKQVISDEKLYQNIITIDSKAIFSKYRIGELLMIEECLNNELIRRGY